MIDNWLVLKVLPKVGGRPGTRRASLLISVPKKIVPLATQRNRLKRLIRESVRQDDFFKQERGIYHFRIGKFPGDLGLQEVQRIIRTLQKGL